jgi:hypothetical protein
MFEMMSLQITSLVLAALAVLVAAYIVFRGHSTAQPTRRVPGARPAPPRAGSQITAAELLVLLKQLDAENAQWTKILSAINPTGDRAIAALLQDLRGPHMFAPHTALGVMLDGARSVGPKASVREALAAARDSMNKVTRFGN